MAFATDDFRRLTAERLEDGTRNDRIKQIERAEKLAAKLDPEREYPLADLAEKLTASRPEWTADRRVSGEEAVQDLRHFAEELSDGVEFDATETGEPVMTVEDVSRAYDVSTKTVDRWRSRGLVSRRVRMGGRKRVAFLESTVKRFVKEHAAEVDRGRRFTQLSQDEKELIVREARSFARVGGCPASVARKLSKTHRRSPETIRYTLRQHDLENPADKLFPNAPELLTEERKQEILARYRRGVPVEKLGKQYCRTKSSIYRILHEVRCEKVMGEPVAFMDSPEFHRPDADELILCEPPVKDKPHRRIKVPAGLPPYLASLYEIALLTREDEQYWFRKMNYLKFKAATLREKIGDERPKSRELDRLEELLGEAVQIKNFLIRSNLRLVVSIAKRHIKPGANFFEMVSDGNISLMRAVEKFDYTKGNKFSTYSTWAIMKNFARSIPQEHRQLDRFRTGKEEVFQFSRDERANPFRQELTNNRQRVMIGDILTTLDSRERDILKFRYGLSEGSEPETLEQVGNRFGVTKERIRQLEGRALKKLRKYADEERLEVPGLMDS